jgi:hypothetical protein
MRIEASFSWLPAKRIADHHEARVRALHGFRWGNIFVAGSRTLVHALVEHRLVEEYHPA